MDFGEQQWQGAYVSNKVSRKIRLPDTYCIIVDNREGIVTAASGNDTVDVYLLIHFFQFRIIRAFFNIDNS